MYLASLASSKQFFDYVFRKFLSLSYTTQRNPPAELILERKYKIGKKIANGAFGQLRYDWHMNFKIKTEENFKYHLYFFTDPPQYYLDCAIWVLRIRFLRLNMDPILRLGMGSDIR